MINTTAAATTEAAAVELLPEGLRDLANLEVLRQDLQAGIATLRVNKTGRVNVVATLAVKAAKVGRRAAAATTAKAVAAAGEAFLALLVKEAVAAGFQVALTAGVEAAIAALKTNAPEIIREGMRGFLFGAAATAALKEEASAAFSEGGEAFLAAL